MQAARAFLVAGGNPPAPGTLFISRICDQGGSNWDCTQSTTANQPQLDLFFGSVNGYQSITFAGQTAGTVTNQFCNLPSGLALGVQSFSGAFAGKVGLSANPDAFMSVKNAGADLLIWQNNAGPTLKATTTQTWPIYPPANPAVHVGTSSAANAILYAAERSQSRTALTIATIGAGGQLGSTIAATSNGLFQMLAFAIYNMALSAGNVASIQTAFNTQWNFQTLFDTYVVQDGDSNMQGTQTTLMQNETVQIYPMLKRAVRIGNWGVFGATMQSAAALGAARLTPAAGWTETTKVYEIEYGNNDLAGLATVTGAANNGSGLIRLTLSATLNAAFITGGQYVVSSVGGVPNANGAWTITKIDSTHVDLQGSTFAGTYTSGGTMNVSALQLQAWFTTLAQAASGLGYCVVARTIIPSTGSTGVRETQRLAYNTWLLANATSNGANFVSDPASAPELQTPSNIYWFPDGLHESNAAQYVTASYDAAAINSCMP